MRDKVLVAVKLVVFILCLALIMIGQKTPGKFELCLMLIGLAGLLGLLYDYNRKYV